MIPSVKKPRVKSVRIFHDPNLGAYASQGWDVHKIASGKISTLSGRTFTFPLGASPTRVCTLKKLIEDTQGIAMDHQTLRTTARVLPDEEIVQTLATNGEEEISLILVVSGPAPPEREFLPKPAPGKFQGGGMCKPRPDPYVTQTVTLSPEEHKAESGASQQNGSQRNEMDPGRIGGSPAPSERVVDRRQMAAAVEARLRKK